MKKDSVIIKKSIFLYSIRILSSFFSQKLLAEDIETLPWEIPLRKIMLSISGPVAKTVGIVVIVLAGLGLAFGENGGGVRRILQVCLGLAIAFSASTIIGSLFN